jgi:hypothetical protein
MATKAFSLILQFFPTFLIDFLPFYQKLTNFGIKLLASEIKRSISYRPNSLQKSDGHQVFNRLCHAGLM